MIKNVHEPRRNWARKSPVCAADCARAKFSSAADISLCGELSLPGMALRKINNIQVLSVTCHVRKSIRRWQLSELCDDDQPLLPSQVRDDRHILYSCWFTNRNSRASKRLGWYRSVPRARPCLSRRPSAHRLRSDPCPLLPSLNPVRRHPIRPSPSLLSRTLRFAFCLLTVRLHRFILIIVIIF